MKTILECIWSFKKSRIPYGLFQLLPAMRCVTEVTAHMRPRGQTDVGKDVFWLFFWPVMIQSRKLSLFS